ncbi:MAG: exodeoxyribonuclease VII large subunit [Candidatus Eiseniibacteriota bacterium]
MTPLRGASRLEPREGDPRVYSVSELAREIQGTLQDSLPYVLVQGEISGLKRHHSSGHVYFDLKDEKARVRVALFKSRVLRSHDTLADGVAVQVEGSVDFYAARGEVSIIAERVAPIGYGALQARFEALKRKLEMEGLFREDRKRPLPAYPTRVGIVTSLGAAALRDMLRVLRQRAPYLRITLAPASVQGPTAADEIASAIELLNEWGQVDVILAGRGGGSIEDLWAFNEEVVVRAIATSRIPVVSAVGHEVDFTLADFAADRRAATPTHAAQEIVADRATIVASLEELSKHARERLRRELREADARLKGLSHHRALLEPTRLVTDGRRLLDDASDALTRGLSDWVVERRRRVDASQNTLALHSPGRTLERSRERLDALAHRARRGSDSMLARLGEAVAGRRRLLASYDHRGVLRRGYALVWSRDGTRLIQRGGGLAPGQELDVQFQDARAEARVTRVSPVAEEETA